MVLVPAFTDLLERVRELSESLGNLLWAVAECRPAQEGHALADHYAEVITEVMGTAQEARAAAAEALDAVNPEHPDLALAGRGLALCHEQVNRLGNRFFSALASFERVSGLASLGKERKGEWLVWSRNVMEEVERCREPLSHVGGGLLRCWQEIAERVGTTSVAARATAIGQQTVAPVKSGAVP
jgi:hypothetical protein